jgi:hypothetical protein
LSGEDPPQIPGTPRVTPDAIGYLTHLGRKIRVLSVNLRGEGVENGELMTSRAQATGQMAPDESGASDQ